MKAKANLFWVVFCILLAASGSVTAVGGNEPIAHWKFDEGAGTIAYDSAGDNDGIVYGAQWTTGQINGALEFDGVDDYVEVDSPEGLNFGSSTDFTFAAWIKAREIQPKDPMIFGRRNPDPHNGYLFFINSYYDGKLAVQLNDGTWTNYLATSGDLRDDTWHHVVATGDRSGYLTFYVDASQKGQHDISTKGNIDSTRNVFIGWEEQNPAVTYFNGTIDDVRMYNRALSAEEIEEIYEEGTGGPISILALDTSTRDTQVLGALTGTVFTQVSPAAFAAVDLSAYDVLYVGSAFKDGRVTIPSQNALDALNARKSDIADFVGSGHGIVALSEPIGTGCYAWLPVSVDSYYGYNWYYDDVVISDPCHPVMEGLTNTGLSDWVGSGHTYFTDTGLLDILATRESGEPVTLAGSFAAGKIVLTGQDPDWHFGNPKPGKQYRQFVQNAIDWVATPLLIPAAVDIKPGSCSNPVNVRSKGVLPVAILGTEDFDVNAIDIASIRLAGVAPIRSSFEDVAAPLVEGNECECTTEAPDGYTDLTLKFRTQQIVEELINTLGDLVDREILALTLEGALSDGPLIVGEDCIVVLGKVPKSIIAKRSDLNEDGIINMVDLTIMANNWLEAAAVDDF